MPTPSWAAWSIAATTSAANPPKLLYNALYTAMCERGAIPLAFPKWCPTTITGIPCFPAATDAVCVPWPSPSKGRSVVLSHVKYSSCYSRCCKMTGPNKFSIARARWKISSNLTDTRKMSRTKIWMLRFIVADTRVWWIYSSVNKPNNNSFSSNIKTTILRPCSLWQTQKLWSMCSRCSNRKNPKPHWTLHRCLIVSLPAVG